MKNNKITIYFSLVSPYVYIGYRSFTRLCDKHQLVVDYKPLNLLSLFSRTGGVPPRQRHISRQNYRKVELQRCAMLRDVPMNLTPRYWPYNSSFGDKMVLAAIAQNGNPAGFIGDCMAGVWAKEKNMADENTLIKTADDNGLDGKKLYDAIENEEISTQYQANEDEAVEKSVFGAPFFEYNNELFWGQDRIEGIDKAITSGRAPIIVKQ